MTYKCERCASNFKSQEKAAILDCPICKAHTGYPVESNMEKAEMLNLKIRKLSKSIVKVGFKLFVFGIVLQFAFLFVLLVLGMLGG